MERAVPNLPVDDLVVALEVEHTDRYYREWRAKAEVLRPPKNVDRGTRTFDLIDPFANTIFVMDPVTAAF